MTPTTHGFICLRLSGEKANLFQELKLKHPFFSFVAKVRSTPLVVSAAAAAAATIAALILRAHGWLLSAGSVLTLIVEIGAPLALFHRYLGWSWALATLAMHQGIALLMGISFPYQTFGLAFLCFLPVERLLPAAWRPRE
jgi:hypothetical protein